MNIDKSRELRQKWLRWQKLALQTVKPFLAKIEYKIKYNYPNIKSYQPYNNQTPTHQNPVGVGLVGPIVSSSSHYNHILVL